eukprot:7719822-Pyramimonas_sp.AAC.2
MERERTCTELVPELLVAHVLAALLQIAQQGAGCLARVNSSGSPNSLPPNPVGGGSPRAHVESLGVPDRALPGFAIPALDLGDHPGVTIKDTDGPPP